MTVKIPVTSPPTDEELKALAEWVGCSLPTGYLDFVRLHDGAEPDANSIKTLENEVSVSRFVPVREARELAAAIDGFPSVAIPLAENDCGNYFYLDPSNGSVHFWDHEVEGTDELLADDVTAFAEKLNPFAVSSAELAPGQAKSVWINPLFKPKF